MALPADPYYYRAFLTWDPVVNAAVGSAQVQFFAEGDSAFASPLQIWDLAGVSLGTSVTSTATGYVAPYVLDVADAVAVSGTFESPVSSYRGLRDAVTELRDAAVAAQAAAETAVAGGGGSGIVGAPASWPQSFPPSSHSHASTDLRRADGSTGLASPVASLLNAVDAQAARAAIGAGTGSGTSNLQLGTTPGTASEATHLHPQYQTEQQVLDLIASNGGGGGAGNVVAVVRTGGAYATPPSSYPAGTVRTAYGSVPPTYGTTPGVVLDLYVPVDGI